MFTWICPQCGNEVPPSQTECLRCAKAAQERAAAAAQPPVAPSPQPVAPVAMPAPTPAPVAAPQVSYPQPAAPMPPQAQPHLQPAYHPPAYEQPKSHAMRDIIVTVGVAAVLLGAGYFMWHRSEEGDAAETKAPSAAMEKVGGAKANPLAKYIELTGFRIREPRPGTIEVKMLLVNHGAIEIPGLKMDVVLLGKGTDKEVASFPVTAKRIAAFGSTELTAQVKTKMRAYELPDWQFIEPRFVITEP